MTSEQSYVAVGTWAFAALAVEKASEMIGDRASGVFTANSNDRGSSAHLLDIVEKAVNTVEEDAEYGVYLVGKGSYRNAAGKHQFDAAIMDGRSLSFGGVCALEGCSVPISVARKVMEKTAHGMLVGTGARVFANEMGFSELTDEELDPVTPVGKQSGTLGETGKPSTASDDGACCRAEAASSQGGHDTLGFIVRHESGRTACGVSTSGPAGKMTGRVGDSALPGCGLYADDTVGAAVVSGDGDTLLRFCPAHAIITRMRLGDSAGDSCRAVARDIVSRLGHSVEIAFLAVEATTGQVGAATTVPEWFDKRTGKTYPGFPYAVWTGCPGQGQVEIHVEPPIS
eukprot:scpid25718/ scgid8124/ N(4)-(Beta-N-acetylglucosaminyl)-L-asparaginase; Aspartylglucosaminidase; Glycosylasparaginase; N4-(N-acetyl-beta-glucosaminyl)-L-asparagine amidase; Glycosylasparaginase alpha chain; Glycosylasparaginase beta chain